MLKRYIKTKLADLAFEILLWLAPNGAVAVVKADGQVLVRHAQPTSTFVMFIVSHWLDMWKAIGEPDGMAKYQMYLDRLEAEGKVDD